MRNQLCVIGVIISMVLTTGFTLRINTDSYRTDVDYLGEIIQILNDAPNDKYALSIVSAYEDLRNAKISDDPSLDDSLKTHWTQAYDQHVWIHLFHYTAHSYQNNIDYMDKMISSAKDNDMFMGHIYESLRNNKLIALGRKSETTYYFTDYTTVQEILDILFPPDYSEEDLWYLSRIVQLECGSSFITDWHQVLTATVVLNRVHSDKYPDTVEGVIFQTGQYAPSGKVTSTTPTDRVYENCKYALVNYGEILSRFGNEVIPADVLYQANFTQGRGTYHSIYVPELRSTTYFCYG